MHTSPAATAPAAPSPAAAPARIAVAGATGYAGQELVRLLARHPAAALAAAMASSHGGARTLPALARVWEGEIVPFDLDRLAEADVAILALPDTAAAGVVPALARAGARVIDLSGAFRLRDEAVRTRWYADTREVPDGVAYGLTEMHRDAVRRSAVVANPGCYPTAAQLAVVPVAAAGLLVPGADIVIDAKSGVSGAGKTPTERTHFCECHGSVSAYGVFNHRHGAEIEQGIGGGDHPLTFVPHLIPVDRGILTTIYARVRPGVDEEAVGDALRAMYEDAAFVRLCGPALPEIKHVAHTNFCDIGWRLSGGRLVMVSVIDNLLKGAAGQAIQNMNVMLGYPETAGLL